MALDGGEGKKDDGKSETKVLDHCLLRLLEIIYSRQ